MTATSVHHRLPSPHESRRFPPNFWTPSLWHLTCPHPGMTPQELRARIDHFADQVITLCRTSPADALTLRLLLQLQNSATSAASNYASACRAQSKPAFIAKLSIALEEADESVGWLQRLSNQAIGDATTVARLCRKRTRSPRF
jgi:four helix bundle protein